MITKQCQNCINFAQSDTSGIPTCVAFPEGIPEVILTGDFDHSKPFEGDNGFRYQPIDATDYDTGESDN